MSNVYFFTGFPGFIAAALVKQLIADCYPVSHIYLLVQNHMISKAEQEVAKLTEDHNIDQSLFTILSGDITDQGLALDEKTNALLREKVTHVYHLAAIYDLAVPYELAYRVNVTGTHMINEWVQTLSQLHRYTYFSTAFVSGNREGTILETELNQNQTFKNHYEQTKFQAELLVSELLHAVPLTIIRPGVVRGHSKTGETIKFDGPYFIFNFFDRLKALPFMPYLGKGDAEGNFVPVDYVLQATLHLSHSDQGIGKTYHITDPKPYSVNELYRMICEKMTGRSPKGRIPLPLAKGALGLSYLRKFFGVEKEAMDYFTCLASFDCSQAQKDLDGSGIVCPDFKESLDVMVSYYNQHKHDQSKHIQIK